MPRAGRPALRRSSRSGRACAAASALSPRRSRAVLPCGTITGAVDSSGCRNTAYVTGLEELVQSLGRCSPAERLSRPAVEGHRHGCKVLGAVRAEVGALWKVLAQQPVGVLVRAALPGAVGIAEVDLNACVDLQARVLGHLGALIPGQRSSQLFGYGDDRARDGVAHRLNPMPGERGPVLGARSVTVARHAGQGGAGS